MYLHLALPYPPSLNRYYRKYRNRLIVSEEGRRFQKAVAQLVGPRPQTLVDKLRLDLWVHPPDARVRDLDNVLKAVQDSLQYAGVYLDDGQIDELHVRRGAKDKAEPRVELILSIMDSADQAALSSLIM